MGEDKGLNNKQIKGQLIFGVVAVLVGIIFLLTRKSENTDAPISNNSTSEIENENELTYEDLEKEFGGIIETDCISVRDYLNELSWKNYYVCGYVVDTNTYSPALLTIADEMTSGNPTGEIMIMQDEERSPLYANEGDFVYASGEVAESFDYETYDLSCYSGYVAEEKIDDEYLSVSDFLKLMGKIYDDTYFKTEGVIIQDGENFEGKPKYYLYPSEESYKEDKLSRVELNFQKTYSNLNGKHVVVMGNPDKNATYQGLKNCNIISGDYVEEIEEQKETKEELNTIKKKGFIVDGEELNVAIVEEDNKMRLVAFGHAKTEEKACLMLSVLKTSFDKIDTVAGYDIVVFCEKLLVTYKTTDNGFEVFGTNKDGSLAYSAPDWLVADFTMSEDEMNSYAEEILIALKEFAKE